jgi:hypothetical protein
MIGVERPPHLVAEASQRADLAFGSRVSISRLELAAGDDLP